MRARYVIICLCIGTALFAWWWHHRSSQLPDKVVIAGGSLDGRYYEISKRLAEEMEQQLGVEVDVLETGGSLDNFHLLREGKADFAMYQPDTARLLDGADSEKPGDAAFVANLYSEVLHVFVRVESGIKDARDLPGHRVSLGPKKSGDYASAKMLLEHLGIKEPRDDSDKGLIGLDYRHVEQQLMGATRRNATLDAACMSAGLQAPVFAKLATDENIKLVDVPYSEAFALKHAPMWPFKIPAGYYRAHPTALPERDIETVAIRAKLLARPGASTALVEAVTNIVLNEQFQRTNELSELFEGGREFAAAKPEFRIHPGAQHVYTPELKPLLNPDFVEGTEGLRSFVVSILIAAWLIARWLRDRRIRAQEHRLDRYIRSLLDIERRQLGLDEDEMQDDTEPLQRLLDEVTSLRQEVLLEFSAHELNEDPSAVCFVQMCHALSDKVNAKLTRQRLNRILRETTPAS